MPRLWNTMICHAFFGPMLPLAPVIAMDKTISDKYEVINFKR